MHVHVSPEVDTGHIPPSLSTFIVSPELTGSSNLKSQLVLSFPCF